MNLAAQKPELVTRAKELFASSRADSADWPIKEGGAGKGGKSR